MEERGDIHSTANISLVSTTELHLLGGALRTLLACQIINKESGVIQAAPKQLADSTGQQDSLVVP